jgi:ACS family allantoate permease-like MFS transporter
MGLLLTLRFMLLRENMKRDCEPHDDTYDDVYMDRVGTDGGSEKIKIDKVRADTFPIT